MVLIREIEPHSLAERGGFQLGDRIHRINGHEIEDPIDFQVYSSDLCLRLEVERDGEFYEVEIERQPGESCGFLFKEVALKRCNNKCIFCFIHQLPRGMRRGLYLEDDDYRLSFLHGSYITLTNLKEHDLERIVEQHLSPQYISVHATDPQLRQLMLGRRQPTVDLLLRIAQLAAHGIEMHTQVVLCPGWNDGPQLERTVRELSAFYPAVRSVALVPVGLTQFRRRLTPLTPVDPVKAGEYLVQADLWGEQCIRSFGERLVYAADELFLLAGRPLPAASYYETFPQIENGIGMVRAFMDTWEQGKDRLPVRLSAPMRLGLVSGQLASRFLSPLLVELNRIVGLEVGLIPVDNTFFGPGITVSGLLTGMDILRTVQGGPWDKILLPPNCINEEGVTLDDMSVSQLEQRAGMCIRVGQYDLVESVRGLLGGQTGGMDIAGRLGQPDCAVERQEC